MKNFLKEPYFITAVLLACVLSLWNYERGPTNENQSILDSLNIEYDYAYKNMLNCDSLFREAKVNNDSEIMIIYHDSTKYYTGKMVKEYNELIKIEKYGFK